MEETFEYRLGTNDPRIVGVATITPPTPIPKAVKTRSPAASRIPEVIQQRKRRRMRC